MGVSNEIWRNYCFWNNPPCWAEGVQQWHYTTSCFLQCHRDFCKMSGWSVIWFQIYCRCMGRGSSFQRAEGLGPEEQVMKNIRRNTSWKCHRSERPGGELTRFISEDSLPRTGLLFAISMSHIPMRSASPESWLHHLLKQQLLFKR